MFLIVLTALKQKNLKNQPHGCILVCFERTRVCRATWRCVCTSRGPFLGRCLYLSGQWQNCPGGVPTKKIIKFCYSLLLPHFVSRADISPALKTPIRPKYA